MAFNPSQSKMPPPPRLASIDEEGDDIGLEPISQSPQKKSIEGESIHHYAAVQQPPTGRKVPSGSTLTLPRLVTNITPGSMKQFQGLPISEPSKSTVLKDMVYEEFCIPFKYKLYVTGSLWLLLFGFVLFSGTFTNFKLNAAEKVLFSRFENVPMLVLGTLFCGASSCALIYLSWKWKNNSIWLVERILL